MLTMNRTILDDLAESAGSAVPGVQGQDAVDHNII
jgi:hypothetical protein